MDETVLSVLTPQHYLHTFFQQVVKSILNKAKMKLNTEYVNAKLSAYSIKPNAYTSMAL